MALGEMTVVIERSGHDVRKCEAHRGGHRKILLYSSP